MTLVDPFAAAPADEAQTAPPAAPVVAPSVPVEEEKVSVRKKPAGTVDVAVRPVIDTKVLGTQVRVTYKGGAAYDAPWITVDAVTVRDALDAVTGENAAVLAELMERVQQAGSHFVSKALANPNATAAAPAQTAAPAGATGAPNGETRQCKHGQMTFRSGFNAAKNKSWSAFFCPTPKGAPDQCAAEWIR